MPNSVTPITVTHIIGLNSSTVYYPMVGGAPINLVDELNYGTIAALAGSFSFDDTWRVSDGSLLDHKNERNLGIRTTGSSGYISVRGPNSSGPAIGYISQTGIGHVNPVRSTQEVSLFGGATRTISTPDSEFSNFNTKANWSNPTAKVDVKIGVTQNSPLYRIYGEGYYGPIGFWVTKDTTLRISEVVHLQFYGNDFELASFDYTVLVNGVTLTSGTMNDDTYVSYSYTPSTYGTYVYSVVFNDANGKTITIPGPTFTILNFPILHGSFITPIAGGRYLYGTDINIRFQYDACLEWQIVHVFSSVSTIIGDGSLSTPSRAITEIILPAPALGTHVLNLTLFDSDGAQPVAATVTFTVVTEGLIITS